jgi:multidrug resistance protein MdtO
MASVITLVLEHVFAAFRRTDDLTDGITERLDSIEKVLECFAVDCPVNAAERSAVARLAIVGTSRLRRLLQRSAYRPQYTQETSAVVALVGRLVDLVANLAQFSGPVFENDRARIVPT